MSSAAGDLNPIENRLEAATQWMKNVRRPVSGRERPIMPGKKQTSETDGPAKVQPRPKRSKTKRTSIAGGLYAQRARPPEEDSQQQSETPVEPSLSEVTLRIEDDLIRLAEEYSIDLKSFVEDKLRMAISVNQWADRRAPERARDKVEWDTRRARADARRAALEKK